MNLVINKDLSKTIICLNSLCIILILMMHCVYTSDGIIMDITNHLFFDTLTRIAVPLFFLISSVLFFRDVPDKVGDYVSGGGYDVKIRKRIKGLLIPYFLAISIYIAFFFLAQQIPTTRAFFKPEQIIENFAVADWIINIFIIPFNGTLWFIRDLFVIYLLSPMLLYFSQNKIMNIMIHILLLVSWMLFVNCHIEAVLFVLVGLDIVRYKPNVVYLNLRRTQSNAFKIIFWMLILTKVMYMTFFSNEKYDVINVLLLKTIIIVGIPYVFFSVKGIVEREGGSFIEMLMSFQKYSFFTYLFHMLILTIIRNLLELVPGITAPLVYLGTLCGTVLVSVIAYKLIARLTPELLSVLIGGRMSLRQ